jgi:hypothetical protein
VSPGGRSAGTAASPASSSPNASGTIVLRRPPSPLGAAGGPPAAASSNLSSLSIGLLAQGSPRRNSNPNIKPGHARVSSGGSIAPLPTGLTVPMPVDEGGAAPTTPRANAAAAANDMPFESIDEMVLGNAAYREVFRIVRLIAAQPSCDQQVLVLEKHAKHLVRADSARVLLVTRHGFTHPTFSQALPLDQGLASQAIHKKEVINISSPSTDPRFSSEADQHSSAEKAPLHYVALPIEGDPSPSCVGARDIVALVQVWRDREGSAAFNQSEVRQIQRLCEFVGNMFVRSRYADRALALYNSSVSTSKRSAALLDVAKALSSETRLSDVVSVIVSQVPEMLGEQHETLL